MTLQRGGGGVLSIFVQQGCAVFRVSLSPIFSRTGYQKKAIFLEQVVKGHVKGGNFVRLGFYLAQYLCFGVYFHGFFLESGII